MSEHYIVETKMVSYANPFLKESKVETAWRRYKTDMQTESLTKEQAEDFHKALTEAGMTARILIVTEDVVKE